MSTAKPDEKTTPASAGSKGSATVGEFTDGRGKVRQCVVLGVVEDCDELLKIRYVRKGRSVVGYILPIQFRADARKREQDRLRHMEEHSNDIYGESPNAPDQRPGVKT